MPDQNASCFAVVLGDNQDGCDIDSILAVFSRLDLAIAAATREKDAMSCVPDRRGVCPAWSWNEKYQQWSDGWNYIGIEEVPFDPPATPAQA